MDNPLATYDANLEPADTASRLESLRIRAELSSARGSFAAPLPCNLAKPGERLYVFDSGAHIELARRITSEELSEMFAHKREVIEQIRCQNAELERLSR